MVTGIDSFKEWFKGFEEQYVIIGGTACDILMTEEGMDFRATKDIDLVLIVEAISADFGRAFWGYVKEAGYRHCNKSSSVPQFYRFSHCISRRTLDALRQPVEDKKVFISRVNGTHTFPSNFMFVAAMNPCPCGYYPSSRCRCTDYEIIKYRGKISGPIMDRIDIQKEVHPVDYFRLNEERPAMSSAEIRAHVEKARKIQQMRYKDEDGINYNAQMSTSLIQKYCVLDEESLHLLKTVSEKYRYSVRVIHKLLRLARTSADLDGVENIRLADVQKVVSCRDLDKSNSRMMVVK